MNKLPFVWKLDYQGIISHAIGSPHGLNMYSPKYIQDLLHYLEDKNTVLVETQINYGGTLDAAIVDITSDRELLLKECATGKESDAFDNQYSVYLNTPEALEPYQKGDAEKIKKIYGEHASYLDAFNNNMFEKSWRWLTIAPSLLVCNLARLLIEPSLLTMYEGKGIKIEKIQ